MTERVLRDFFAAFRWKKIKESYKKGTGWIVLYLITFAALFSDAYESVNNTLAYYLIAIPILFAIYIPTLHNMRLPKIMYLCPVSEAKRREYIVKSCAVRVTASVLMDIAGVTVLLACGICNGLTAIGILINLVLLSVAISSGINTNGYAKITEEGNRVINQKSKKELLEIWICIMASLFCVAYYFILLMKWESLLVGIITIGLSLVVVLPCAIVYLRFGKQAVTENMNYEG